MRHCVIIVAGGSGSRFGSAVPKQFLELVGKPVLMRTIDAFEHVLAQQEHEITVVLPQAQIGYWQQLCKSNGFATAHKVVAGGSTRFESVKNGLGSFGSFAADDLVAVHDGVRPLVAPSVITGTFALAAEKGSAIPVVKVVDSVRLLGSDGKSVAVDRSTLRAVQTPQTFNAQMLSAAYNVDYDPLFTDDASVFERTGHDVWLCDGDERNLKITHKLDLTIAEKILDSE